MACQVDEWPVVQGEELEKGEDGVEEVSKVLWISFLKQFTQHHGRHDWEGGGSEAKELVLGKGAVPLFLHRVYN